MISSESPDWLLNGQRGRNQMLSMMTGYLLQVVLMIVFLSVLSYYILLNSKKASLDYIYLSYMNVSAYILI